VPHPTIALDSTRGRSIGPYTVAFAAGTQAREDEYRLRYALFVEEHAWLEGNRVERMEIDEFDRFSCAFLLRDRETGEAAACQRLILPDRLPAGLVTNIERLTPSFANQVHGLTRDSWAEVSRTSIAQPYRWGRTGSAMPAMVAIQYASLALAIAFGRQTVFSFSDPRTARLTRRLGLVLRTIGAAIQLHGERLPYRIDMREVLSAIPAAFRGLLDDLTSAADAARTAGF
jgi:N-acyl-L-homoserine lactone synthetase